MPPPLYTHTCVRAGEQLAWWLLAQHHALRAAWQVQQEGGVGLAMLKLLHLQGTCWCRKGGVEHADECTSEWGI